MATLQEKRTIITSLDHLREVANGEDGQPPVEVNLLLNGGAFTRKYIQHCPGDENPWWVEEDGNDGRYYTDAELATMTYIVQGIERSALILVEDD